MKKMISIMFLLLILMISSPAESAPTVPALYVFGDSLFDSGNNNLLPTLAKADFHPYGMNFHGGATGRFTNGRTVADFIAEYLGLPYSPPYLNIVRVILRANDLTGLNFASGACGILPETGKDLGKCLNIEDQFNLFERVVRYDLPSHYNNSAELSNYMSRSLFLISIGSNDYINNYLDTKHYDSRKRYNPQAFARLLTDRLSLQLERLYKLGARKVIVFENGPIGCIPSITRQFKHKGLCDEEINSFTNNFNDNLAKVLRNLTATLRGSDFILGHAHWLGYDAIIHPSNYGLSDSTNPCCLTWLNGTSACIPELGAFACHDPEQHYFWDGYHLTETVYRTIASRCINDNSVCVPKSIRQLVRQF